MKNLNKNDIPWYAVVSRILMFIAIMLGTTYFWQVQAQDYWQLEATGYNDDVVADGSGSASATTTAGIDNGQFAFASEDWQGTPEGSGLPANGIINSSSITELSYQIPPYDENNSLRLTGTDSGTLTLTDPTAMSRLYILGVSGEGDSNLDITVTFNDGSTESFEQKMIPDWYYSTALPVEKQGFGRVSLSDDNFEEDVSNPRLYRLQLAITADNWEKEVTEIAFEKTNAGDSVLNIMALSGTNDTSYCEPEGTNSSRYIDNFSATGDGDQEIDNQGSGFSDGGYGDFTDMVVSVNAHSEINFEADIETGTGGFRIWVDWNNDGIFDPEEEVAYQSSGYSANHEGSFDIPGNADGDYRMRIVSHYLSTSGDIDPCETGFIYGEFEDYTVSVIPLEACANANAGTLTTQDMSVCAGAVFTLEVEGNSEPANGLTGQWMSSVDGGTDWSAVEGATSASYTVSDGITEETQFKYVVSCDMDDSSDETEVVTISMSPAIECYCEPEGTNSSRYINNFSATGEGDQEIDNQGSGFSDGGYGDFTDMVVSADADSEINFEADIVGGNAGFRIWVDWNNDGIFDPEEEVAYQSSSYENSHAGSFDVPGDADGDYRMRIVSHWLSTSGDIAPCATGFSYGEFEDYTVSVTPVDCLSPSDLEVTDITANSATVSWEGDADNYNYAVTTEDEEPADADDSTGDNSVDLGNLDDNTTYYVWVQADCGESQSNWNSISFSTACYATGIPFTQDFEDVTIPDIPNCGSIETLAGGQDWATTNDIYGLPDEFNGNVLYFHYTSTSAGAADAWYFTQGIELEAGEEYKISYKYSNNSSSTFYTEKLKVAYGTSPAASAMDNELMDHPDVSGQVVNTSEVNFTPDTDGVYYFGFQAYSDANQYYLFVDDIHITSCEAITEFPWTESFEDAASKECWSQEYVNGTEDWDLEATSNGNNTISPRTGDYMAEFRVPSSGPTTKLITPVLDLSEVNNPELEFYFANVNYFGDIDELRVYYKTGESSDWIQIGEDYTSEHTSWTQVTLNLPEPSSTYYIAFEGKSKFARGLDIDDITVREGQPAEECESPLGITVDNVTDDSAEITWSPANDGDDQWEISLTTGGQGADDGIIDTVSDTPSYTATGLEPEVQYSVYLRTICSDEVSSDWAFNGTFETLEAAPECNAPTNVDVTNITDTTAEVSWTAGGFESQWEVLYGTSGFDTDSEGESVLVGQTSYTIEDLEAETEYDVYVRSVCGENYSDWVGPETFTTEEEPVEECEAPTDVEVTDVTETTAEVTWTPQGDEESWAVIYGESGFSQDDEDDFETDIVLAPTHTLEDLTPLTDYDIYVFAICDEDEMIYSDQVGPITFTTDDMSVDSQKFNNFTFYPNPVENQLSLKAGTQIENVQIYNLVGQQVIDVQPNSLETQINTEVLQSGVYLMKVSINGSQKTFRVVKK